MLKRRRRKSHETHHASPRRVQNGRGAGLVRRSQFFIFSGNEKPFLVYPAFLKNFSRISPRWREQEYMKGSDPEIYPKFYSTCGTKNWILHGVRGIFISKWFSNYLYLKTQWFCYTITGVVCTAFRELEEQRWIASWLPWHLHWTKPTGWPSCKGYSTCILLTFEALLCSGSTALLEPIQLEVRSSPEPQM